jgi:hypothetical protein
MPVSQYGMPAAQYGMPAAQHGMPAAQPSMPAAQPSMPAAQPSMPAAQPSMPAAQPSMPAAQPSMPAAQPSMPASQPSMPASKPGMPAAQHGTIEASYVHAIVVTGYLMNNIKIFSGHLRTAHRALKMFEQNDRGIPVVAPNLRVLFTQTHMDNLVNTISAHVLNLEVSPRPDILKVVQDIFKIIIDSWIAPLLDGDWVTAGTITDQMAISPRDLVNILSNSPLSEQGVKTLFDGQLLGSATRASITSLKQQLIANRNFDDFIYSDILNELRECPVDQWGGNNPNQVLMCIIRVHVEPFIDSGIYVFQHIFIIFLTLSIYLNEKY